MQHSATGVLLQNNTYGTETQVSERYPRVREVKVAQELKFSLVTMHRVLVSPLWLRLWALCPPLAPGLRSLSWKLFTVQATNCFTLTHTNIHTHTRRCSTSFSLLAPIFDITPTLTCEPSLSSCCIWCLFTLSLSVFPATSAVAWKAGGERRAEETGDFARSKYSLYVCGVLSSKERRDRVHFL